MTAQIIDNLKRALVILEAAPSEGLYLDSFKSPCGTIHCAAGLLTTDPYFNSLGMGLRETYSKTSYLLVNLKLNETAMDTWNFTFLDAIFGVDAFDCLFDEYGVGDYDKIIIESETDFNHDEDYFDYIDWEEYEKPMTDKQLAISRLALRIRNYEAQLKRI